jgi:hypothetical protein
LAGEGPFLVAVDFAATAFPVGALLVDRTSSAPGGPWWAAASPWP